MTPRRRASGQLRYRVAFFVTGLVALSLVVTLPFSVKTVVAPPAPHRGDDTPENALTT